MRQLAVAPANPNDGFAHLFVLDDGSINLLLPDGTTKVLSTTPITNLSGWHDLLFRVTAEAPGPAAPTLTAFGPTGNIKNWAFGIGDSVYLTAHVLHNPKVGSTCYPHVHWTTNGVNTASVKWQIDYTFCKSHNQESFPADTTITVEEAAYGAAWRSMTTEHPVGFVIPEVDTIINIKLTRITNGGTDNTDTVFGLFVDLHYESDGYGTPLRIPPFYT